MYTYSYLSCVHSISTGQCRDWGDLLADNQTTDGFALPRCGASSKFVVPLLHRTLVGFDEISQHFCMCGSDDAGINIRTRSQVVEDTGGYGSSHQGQSVFSLFRARSDVRGKLGATY